MDQDAIQRMITDAVNSAVARLTAQPSGGAGPPGPPGPPGPAGDQGPTGTGSNGHSSWNPQELGYFDPLLDKAFGDGDVISAGKDTYFRNVHLFIDRIEDVAATKGTSIVRTNVNLSLRGSALKWYTAELSNLERLGLRSDMGNGVQEWCKALRTRFKSSTSEALSKLTSTKYTITNVRN